MTTSSEAHPQPTHQPTHRPIPQPLRTGATLDDLSEREVQVLRLIAAGRSNQEIATDLAVSPSAVKASVRSAYRIIGVRSRSQAVLWGLFHGLFPGS